jgi:hypothetical protein
MTGKPPDRYVVCAYHGEGAPRPPNHDWVIHRQSWRYWNAADRWMSYPADRMVGNRRYTKDEFDEAMAERDRLNAESGAKL